MNRQLSLCKDAIKVSFSLEISIGYWFAGIWKQILTVCPLEDKPLPKKKGTKNQISNLNRGDLLKALKHISIQIKPALVPVVSIKNGGIIVFRWQEVFALEREWPVEKQFAAGWVDELNEARLLTEQV